MSRIWMSLKEKARKNLSRELYLRCRMIVFFIAAKINAGKINRVMDQLADQYSKDTLRAYIDMLSTGRFKELLRLSKPAEEQYFDNSVFMLGTGETFVDMGVLDAASSIQFSNVVHNSYRNILLFEPDPESYKRSKENIIKASLKNAYIFPEGCGDCCESVIFDASGTGGSCITNSGDGIPVNIVSLDWKLRELHQVDNISYIKMDIEGAEKKALMGAKETIAKYKPKLAVSIYHKLIDYIDLPLTIKELLPEYKLYIRSYNYYGVDSDDPVLEILHSLKHELVCYAVCQ